MSKGKVYESHCYTDQCAKCILELAVLQTKQSYDILWKREKNSTLIILPEPLEVSIL